MRPDRPTETGRGAENGASKRGLRGTRESQPGLLRRHLADLRGWLSSTGPLRIGRTRFSLFLTAML